jgi:hypothetical protein
MEEHGVPKLLLTARLSPPPFLDFLHLTVTALEFEQQETEEAHILKT